MALLYPPGADLTHSVIGAAIEVHTHLGPGLLESTYVNCLVDELTTRAIAVQAEVPVRLSYKGRDLGAIYRLDLLVGGQVVVEVKAVEALTAVHKAQLMTYLKLMKLRTGLLINFNVAELRQGVRRILL